MRNVSLSGLIKILGIAAKCITALKPIIPSPDFSSGIFAYPERALKTSPDLVISKFILSTPSVSYTHLTLPTILLV